MISAWLSWVSMGLVGIGALLGIGAIVWPLRLPGAISLGLALWAAAVILKIVREYLLGIPVPLNLLSPLEGHEIPLLEKRQNPFGYSLYFLLLLAVSVLAFVLLLRSALDAFRGP
jgi:hypothetical protein